MCDEEAIRFRWTRKLRYRKDLEIIRSWSIKTASTVFTFSLKRELIEIDTIGSVILFPYAIPFLLNFVGIFN